jgi:glycosyltransferase involved in cell wall biosynthesis
MNELLTSGRYDIVYQVSGYLLGVTPIRAAKSVGIPIVVMAIDFWFICPTIHLLTGRGTLCGGPNQRECARCLRDRRRRYRLVDRRAPWLVERWISMRANLLPGQQDFRAQLDRLRKRQHELLEALNSVDAIVTRSHFSKAMLVRNGVVSTLFQVAGLPPPGESPASDRTSRSDGSLRIGYIGQLVPIKGVDVLIRAFRRLDPRGRRLELVIYGDPSANPGHVRWLRHLAGRRPGITFAGRFDPTEREAVFASIDLLVVPSVWYENAPLVVEEAQEAGLPVVASNLGSLTEVVRDGVDGLLFEGGNDRALAARLQELVDHPERLRDLRRQVRQPAGHEGRFPEIQSVFNRLLAERAGPVAAHGKHE